MRLIAALLLLMPLVSIGHEARGHDPGLSFAEIRIGKTDALAALAFARRELEPLVAMDADGDGAVSSAEFAAARPRLEDLAPALLTLRAGARVLPPVVVSIDIDDSDAIRFALRYDTGTADALQLGAPVIARLARGHRQYLSVRTADGRPIVDRILDARAATVTIAGPDSGEAHPNVLHQLGLFLREGVWHIWIGFDHVLFLITLLLPAVLRRRADAWEGVDGFGAAMRQVVLVVTAFTIAHSVTLSLAVLGLVDLPSRLTESIIAASVIVAALNNLWPVVSRRLWAVAFAFGLVHGLGFVGALTDLGLPDGAEAIALIGFNAGVELGQLAIVAAILPAIYALRGMALYRLGAVQLGSASIALVAALWLAERAFDLSILPI